LANTAGTLPQSKSAFNSIEDQFLRYNSKTSGFDYLRIILAVGVLAWHSYGLNYGRSSINDALSGGITASVIQLILPMFFALSGFLVTTSLFRTNSIKTYLIFRGLRLFPALTVEVLLAALFLGPLVTTMTFHGYFSDGLLYKYFFNIFGLIQYELPGVFEDNIYPRVVNGSLWTVPYELECYIYLVIFALIGIFRNKYFVLLAFATVTVMVTQLGFTSSQGMVVALKDILIVKTELQPNLQQATDAVIDSARILVLCFLGGAVLYVWRKYVPCNAVLGLSALVLSVWLLSSPSLYYFAALPVAYLTTWLGLQNPPRWSLLDKGDYSYGIYLYAFPIQQVVSASGLHGGNYVVHILMSLALVSIFAVFSWHVIEKPALKLKRHFL